MILKFNMTVINTIQNSLNKEQILSSDHRMVRKTWSHALNRRNGAHWVLSVLYRGGRNLIITFSNFITCTAFSFSILLKFHLHRRSFFSECFEKLEFLFQKYILQSYMKDLLSLNISFFTLVSKVFKGKLVNMKHFCMLNPMTSSQGRRNALNWYMLKIHCFSNLFSFR